MEAPGEMEISSTSKIWENIEGRKQTENFKRILRTYDV
jgi:hypothetical protein